MKKRGIQKEYDFSLVVAGVAVLDGVVEDALFKAGCDDATPSMRYGRLYLEFSRQAASLKDGILSAIRDVHRAQIHAEVLSVDENTLVTASEIARRMGRSRQLVHQYINGHRGPRGFPSPVCHLGEGSPAWEWSTVSCWLAENGLLREEEGLDAQVVAAVNLSLQSSRQRRKNPKLVDEISRKLALVA